jgi:hypothetical protein
MFAAMEGRGMAKKAGVSAYDAGERETIDYLTKLFEAAKFQIQRELDLGGRSRPDLVVGREESLAGIGTTLLMLLW